MTTPHDKSELLLLSKQGEHAWGPTEPDEVSVLDRYADREYTEGGADWTYTLSVASLAPVSASTVINYAQSFIGQYGRPNTFTREYAGRHGAEFLTAPWCDMFVTCIARHTTVLDLTPGGDRAYTPRHADDFVDVGRWFAGNRENIVHRATTGDIAFFDWNGTDTVSAIDHVGLVVKNLGDGRLITVEGNTGSNEVRNRVRGADVIAGFGEVAYVPTKPSVPSKAYPYGTRMMRKGWINSAGVKKVQSKLNAEGYRPKLVTDGDFGSKTEAGVKWFQRREKLSVDGIVGPITWRALFD